jgi:TRAP-type C4-dicarboxylate transport system permease small subunit
LRDLAVDPGVQARRGHVAIEALTGLLSPRANRIRLIVADVVSLGFVVSSCHSVGTLSR